MPRAQLLHLVTTTVGSTVQVSNSAIVTVRKSDDSLATLYAGPSGSPTVYNPIAADASGKVSAWVEIDQYLLVVEGPDFSYSEYWDAVPADSFSVHSKGFVSHGADAGVRRPIGFKSVEWAGSVAPVFAVESDTWVNTGWGDVVAATLNGVWPDRPGGPDGLSTVLWFGGVEPEDEPEAMNAGDLWFPGTLAP